MNRYRIWHRLRGHHIALVGTTGLFASQVRECACGDRWIDEMSMGGILVHHATMPPEGWDDSPE